MRALLLLVVTLVPTLALRRVEVVEEAKPNKKKVSHCQVPAGFKRRVNPNAHRKPSEAEMRRADFYAAPHIEKIYYINLEKADARRENIEEQIKIGFPGVKSERFPATGKGKAGKIVRANMRNYTFLGYGDYSGVGVQATYVSHHSVLEKIAQEKDSNNVYLIVEDDIRLNREGLMDNVNCQLQMLPPEWDLFKFGYWGFRMDIGPEKHGKYPYPSCPGQQINEATCHQEHFNWNYMGNQAYAVRPQGARVLIEHMKKAPIMDVDGAMMPGVDWSKKVGKPLWPNTYVSKWNIVDHGGFASQRMSFNAQVAEEALDEGFEGEENEADISDRLAEEEDTLADDEDSRETSMQAFKRIQRGETEFSKLTADQFD